MPGNPYDGHTLREALEQVEIQSEIQRLQAMERAPEEAPDGQISLTDPDARAIASPAAPD